MASEDRPDQPSTAVASRAPRRLLAIAGLVMAIGAVAVFVADPRGDEDGGKRGAVPEAGSKFREGAGGRDTTLLQALAPVLGRGGSDVRRGLPLESAAAKVLAVGFDGRQARGTTRRRMAFRDWGALIVTNRNYVSPSQLRRLTRGALTTARRSRNEPPLIAANPALIGGLGPRPQVDIGAEGGPPDARREAREAGRRLRKAGVGLVFAPTADLGIGGGPSETRAFSDDPLTAARFVRAAVDGWNDANVFPVPGRFPGEGGASQDPLAGAATVGLSLDELVARDLRPFAASSAQTRAIQMSAALYAAWDSVTPATILPDAIRLLRSQLDFKGVVVSADLVATTAATGGGVGDAAVQALRAGCDLLVIPGGASEQDAAYRAIVGAVRRGELPRKRLDEAVARVRALTRRVRNP